ncbi:MAG TPA: proton-conducting transporter membrane subunit [Baekduia sp.]|nr:proton-conducting transporter membrane subunit [Baekduia sp.]
MALAPLAIAVPIIAACLLVMGDSLTPRALANAVAIGTASATVVLCALLLGQVWHGTEVFWMGGWHPREGGVAVGIDLAVDPLGAGSATFAAAVATAALVYSSRYLEAVAPMFQALMLVMLAGMVGLCLTGDLFNLFVFFELLSVPAYALTAYRIEHGGPLQGGLGFALVNSIGSFLVVSGIGLVYGRTGALNLAQIGDALAGHPADGLVVVAFTLIACGFLVKAAIVPFHFWLADAYAAAPVPVCILFSGVMVELAMLGLARVLWTAFSGAEGMLADGVGDVLAVVGLGTALLGAVMTFLQHRLKRMLAFATIAHSGMLLTGIAVLDAHGLGGVAMLGLANGMVTASLFMAVGILSRRLGSISERGLHGRGGRERVAGGVLLLGGLALASVPPLGIFAGKALVEEAATARGWGVAPALFLVVSALTGGAVLRAVARIFLGVGQRAERDPLEQDEEGETGEHEPSGAASVLLLEVPMIALLVAGLAAGAIPEVRHAVEHAAGQLVDRHAYASQVLEGRAPPGTTAPPPSTGPYTSSYLYAIGSLVGALACAAAALFMPRTRPLAVLARGGDLVRRWHTGHLGDYATWAVVGVVALGWALAAAAT